MNRIRFAALASLTSRAPVALATTLALCASAAMAQDAPVIGLITKTETNPYFVKMKEGAAAAAKAKGAKLLTAGGKADGDNASQVTALENMVAAGAKTILLVPSDSKAIVPAVKKARDKGVLVIALDSPTDPTDAVDALFATNNYRAGVLIGQYAKAALGGKPPVIVTLDLFPGHPVGAQRHNGFMNGLGLTAPDAKSNELGKSTEIACMADSYGDQAKGQTGMENCLQRAPNVNLVYAINEPAAAGAYNALKKAGKEKGVIIVAVDGGCQGVKDVGAGKITATSQQYPLAMARMGVEAGVEFARTGKKPSGYTDTGVALIADKAVDGVTSLPVAKGQELCWGNK